MEYSAPDRIPHSAAWRGDGGRLTFLLPAAGAFADG